MSSSFLFVSLHFILPLSLPSHKDRGHEHLKIDRPILICIKGHPAAAQSKHSIRRDLILNQTLFCKISFKSQFETFKNCLCALSYQSCNVTYVRQYGLIKVLSTTSIYYFTIAKSKTFFPRETKFYSIVEADSFCVVLLLTSEFF